MSDLWFSDPISFGSLVGGIGGGVGGSLFGLFGACCGILIRTGKGKKFVIGGMAFFALLGVGLLVTGIVAIAQDQPKGIYLPFLIMGIVFIPVAGGLLPYFMYLYAVKEKEHLAAEEFRKS